MGQVYICHSTSTLFMVVYVLHVVPYVLQRAALLFPKRAVKGPDTVVSYAEMWVRVRKAASFLESIGVGKGSIIAVADWNTVRFMELHYAAGILGAIIYPVNIRLPPQHIEYTLKRAEAEYLLVSKEFQELVKLSGAKAVSIDDYEDKIAKQEPLDEIRAKPNDPYSILFTSGTTGLPKPVMYTHEKVLMGALSIAHQLALYDTPAKLTSSDVMHPLIPMFHLWAWGTIFIAPYIGAKLVLGGRFDPTITAEIIEKEKVTWINAVPTMIAMLLATGRRFDGLKVLVGGSPLTTSLARKMKEAGMRFSVIYGATDMLATSISILTDHTSEEMLREVTHPVPFVEVKIVKMDGSIAKPGEMGEIWVKAPWLPGGYYKDPEKTKESYTSDGWFKTGDIGVLTEDGGLKVLDRVKDAIKSGGEWIPSSILESIISEVPGVELVAVIPMPDEKWGERPLAVVKGNVSEEVIRDYLEKAVREGRIVKWWIPDKIVFVDEIPLTSTGKINKLELKRRLGV